MPYMCNRKNLDTGFGNIDTNLANIDNLVDT
jgi:hypothetical protein